MFIQNKIAIDFCRNCLSLFKKPQEWSELRPRNPRSARKSWGPTASKRVEITPRDPKECGASSMHTCP